MESIKLWARNGEQCVRPSRWAHSSIWRRPVKREPMPFSCLPSKAGCGGPGPRRFPIHALRPRWAWR